MEAYMAAFFQTALVHGVSDSHELICIRTGHL